MRWQHTWQNHSNLSGFYENVCISLPIGRADHATLLFILKLSAPKQNITKKRVNRPMLDSAIRSFGAWISEHDWSEVTSVNDVNIQWTEFYNTLYSAINMHFPLQIAKVHSCDKPWITPEIKVLIRRRQKAYYNKLTVEWKRLQYRVIVSINKAKREYYSKRFQRLKKNNPPSWYREVRVLTGNNRDHLPIRIPGVNQNDSVLIANAINDHFVSIASDLVPLNLASLLAYLPSPASCPKVSPWDVQKVLRNI